MQNRIVRWLVTIACLFAAFFCYALGIESGMVFFIVLGGVLELTFWFRVVRRRRHAGSGSVTP